MKKKFMSIALIITMLLLTGYLIKISINKNRELNNNNKSKQVLPKIKSGNQNKDSNQYSDVSHMVNKYNGEIKEFKTKNNDSKLIDADLLVIGNEKMLSDFLGELKGYKDLNNFNSITLGNSSGNAEKYSLEVNAEIKTDKK